MRPSALCFCLLLVFALGCPAPDSQPAAPHPVDGPLGLPLLPEGNHVGYILGFSPLNDGNREAVLAREEEVVEAGLAVARVQISWKDLEPSPRVYDAEALNEALEQPLSRGLAVMLTLETIDSSSFEIPDDLLEDELLLAEGRGFDDPVLLERFDNLLAWLTPRLAATRAEGPGVYAITVGNEPDNTIADQPSLGPQVAGFVAHAQQTVRSLDPELAVSMTLTAAALEPGNTYAAPVVEGSDFLAINYYCHTGLFDYAIKSVDETEADLDAMRTLAAGRPIVIQELGCSPGLPEGVLGVGEEDQAVWLQRMVDRFEAEPQTFRAAYWFTLSDWSPEVAGLISQPLCDEGFPDLCASIDEATQTHGLLRWEDGSARPGFEVLVAAVARD